MSEEQRALQLCPVQPPALPMASIDVAGCSAFELIMALHEHETAGLRFESWPAPVRERMERELDAWGKRNPGRILRVVASAVHRRTCVLLIYHAARDGT